jgi:hypothetical protein
MGHLTKKIMKFFLLIFWLSFTILSCNNKKHSDKQELFKAFDFSYNDVFSTCFSIKFTQNDTVFIRQHFASVFSDTPKSNTTYYSLLTNSEKTKLDSFVNNTDFLQFDTLYYQSYEDGLDYQFYFDNDTAEKLIRVHSDSVPFQLETLRRWILLTKKQLLLHQIDTTINFGSLKNFLPPTIPAPLIKFKIPKVQ